MQRNEHVFEHANAEFLLHVGVMVLFINQIKKGENKYRFDLLFMALSLALLCLTKQKTNNINANSLASIHTYLVFGWPAEKNQQTHNVNLKHRYSHLNLISQNEFLPHTDKFELNLFLSYIFFDLIR